VPEGLGRKTDSRVNSEHPSLFSIGLLLSFISIIWQIFLIEKPPLPPKLEEKHKRRK